MTAVMTARWQSGLSAATALDLSARLWWCVTAAGQWIFAAYVAGYYIPMLSQGGLQGLQKAHLFNGYMPGDGFGNVAVAAHVLLAVVLLGGGPLQLVPQIRTRFPSFHRWLGRTYMLTAVTSSIGGLYLIWTRPIFGALANSIATSLDGVLIIVFAAIALRHAIARNIVVHRRWALRLFMVTSAVWFLRIGFRAWSFFTGGIGIENETFSGPFVYAWHFGQYLLPLAILELYFRARASDDARHRIAMAVGLSAVTLVMGVGIYLAATKSWLPRLFEATY